MGEPIDFPKESRLLKPSDFSYFKSKSGAFRTHLFLALYKDSKENLAHSRLGLSVTKKFGKAHRRNRAKRILRELFRSSPIRHLPYDILFILNKKFDQVSEIDIDLGIKSEFERFVAYLHNRQN